MQIHEIPGKKCLLIGEKSLLAQCGQRLASAGFDVVHVVSHDPQCCAWAESQHIPVSAWLDNDLNEQIKHVEYDLLFSITNLRLLPGEVLNRPNMLAINFHDGPLPAMRGLNTPHWALLHEHQTHAINWHLISSGIDRGELIITETFDIDIEETAFTLNAKCYVAALQGFDKLIEQLENGKLELRTQPADGPSKLFRAADRPAEMGLLYPDLSLAELQRLVRALDTGPYENPLVLPRLVIAGHGFAVKRLEVIPQSSGAPKGQVVAARMNADEWVFSVAWDAYDIRLTSLSQQKLDLDPLTLIGQSILKLSPEELELIEKQGQAIGFSEAFWIKALQDYEPTPLCYSTNESSSQHGTLAITRLKRSFAQTWANPYLPIIAYCARIADQSHYSCALEAHAHEMPDFLAHAFKPFTCQIDPDSLLSQQAGLQQRWEVCLGQGPVSAELHLRNRVNMSSFMTHQPVQIFMTQTAFDRWCGFQNQAGFAIFIDETQGEQELHLGFAGQLLKEPEKIADEIMYFVEQLETEPFAKASLLSEDALREVMQTACGDQIAVDGLHVLAHFRSQVAQNPDAIAVVYHDNALTYRALDRQAQAVASSLRQMGVKSGDKAGLMMPRNIHLMPAMLGILYAGAAFVPMDPTYPQDRLEYMAEDAELKVILSESFSSLTSSSLSKSSKALITGARVIPWSELSVERSINQSESLFEPDIHQGLAYMIYTSGSTGRPKGVMVEHAQLVNFCEAMSRIIPLSQEKQDAWLALTSISFDISILELIWTLTKGMKLVIYDGQDWQPGASVLKSTVNKPIDFSLFYWNLATHEDKPGSHRYQILLDGARYGDENGFKAVWTPERHFGEFGGLYPNPVVSSAAIATITKKIQIRAGSCVVPLHHPIRIAEEWAMVDNLSDGRVGLSAAAGWMPNDFVIMPDNFIDAKDKMFASLEQVRQLWRGESVAFDGPKGKVDVRTLPRPVQKELPVWVTTAGNPDNFRKAGELGLNLLTHLLGQTTEELAEKIKIYQSARAQAGHKGEGHVSLMLHTFIADTDDEAKAVAREPMKNYLKTALFLVKSAAWEFPTFKKLSESQGQSLDEYFATISDDDMDALLDFAFERYYSTSGLFGTPERCIEIVDQLKTIGVSEIACLIDYGIATQTVLDHLPLITRVMQASQTLSVPQKSYGFASLMQEHAITHLQCTPSTARLMALDDEIVNSLSQLTTMLVGGEALPLDLAQQLKSKIKGPLLNMYGPTETTIWSSFDSMEEMPSRVCLGRPIANTQLVVMDKKQQPVPRCVIGELYIGGHGVVPGYWQRPELTQERFVPDQLSISSSRRWYRTGDLVRYNQKGELEYLGRNDFQVKIRGFRIELGEIEAKMLELEGVREAVVNAIVTHHASEPRLVGYYTLHKEAGVTEESLKRYLHNALASFMVPSAFMKLEAMPLTPNAKIDRKALPQPNNIKIKSKSNASQHEAAESKLENALSDASQTSPSDMEQQVLQIWKEVLEIEDLSINDNFFERGGHSLLVVDVIARLKPILNKPIRLVDFFRFPQVRSLVTFLNNQTEDPQNNDVIKAAQSRGAARRAARRGRT